jgi:hypothetical protein
MTPYALSKTKRKGGGAKVRDHRRSFAGNRLLQMIFTSLNEYIFSDDRRICSDDVQEKVSKSNRT